MCKNEIRDPLYGFIYFDDRELKIVNTKLLQRLRRIRQLACAYLLYPSALHTRFEHTLGVSNLAEKMSKRLIDDKETQKYIKLSALLHDVGHGPFSHVSEYVLSNFSKIKSKTTEKIHEKITLALIKNDRELKKIIGTDTIKIITGILSGTKYDYSAIRQIITGPLDADKQDYLLRDSYFCGVKYGIYDYERLINTITKLKDVNDTFIAIKRDGIHALEQFILAKYYMNQQVYRHRVRLITDHMIIRAIELGIEEDNDKVLENIYVYKNDSKYFDNYINWWDDKLINYFIEKQKGYASEIFRMIFDRKLFKQIFTVKIDEIEDLQSKTILQDISKKEYYTVKKKIEKEIAKTLKLNDKHVIVNSYSIKNVREIAKDDEKEGEIMVIDNGNRNKFEDVSSLFRSINKTLKESYIEVYANVKFNDERDKKNMKQKWFNSIKDILKEAKKFNMEVII